MTRLACAAIATTLLLGGCATNRPSAPDPEEASSARARVYVAPWERDVLARPDMAWEPDAHRATRRAHIFFSKEAALVGGSVGGGGCGCN